MRATAILLLRAGVLETDSGGRGSLVTPYLHPDHDNLELFVRMRAKDATVSDLGETLRKLDRLGLDVATTKGFAHRVRQIADGYRVSVE
jgi:hypothetical protein